ncbi:uncharacterized protein LOC129939424 [Eupeodes corollae]|uniref:uncharacterized protein LOC129939424 n=1 Tax=Eupeodes corollae TaxID=290404 RepID=UPI00249205F8|nr:uncharacterized protein LOC129939424 [Eupeodes corollae]XP_055903404.1 uncharacterized protein LOC129939424 [Eupeodes corollae]XP_055903405.1 uncharacterized protein LOC129939424 [Eupeodes corollae]
MSCQQAPRLTEDPYVFTEAVSSAPVLFNPQKSRNPHNPKPVCQSLPQLSRESTNANVAQQFFSSRFNGTTTAIETPSASITQQQQIINGMHKNVISITTISNGNSHLGVPLNNKSQQHQHQQQQQPQHLHSHPKIVTTAAVTVTPAATVSSCCSLPTQVISWNQTPTSSSTSPPAQQQQHQQLQQQHHQQQQSFFTLTTNCGGGNVQSLPSPSTLLPPSNFHQNTLAQQLQKVGSTLTNANANSTAPAHWQRQQQYSKVSVYPQNAPPSVPQKRAVENIVTCHATSSPPSSTSSAAPPSIPPDQPSVQPNHSDINEIPVSVIYRTTPIKSEPGTSPRVVQEAPSTPTVTSPIRKPTKDLCDKNVVFATPAKRDARVLSSSAKKSLKGSNTGAPGKAKRTQNQTTHHEALPRIPSINHHSSSTTSPSASSLSLSSASYRRRPKTRRNSGEWHAPDTYIFDSVSPLTSHIERRQRSAEKCDITITSAKASCVQKHWMGVYDLKDPYGDDISARALNIGREERIERHKALLRRQAVQLISSHAFLKPTAARSRLVFVSKFLQKLKKQEDVELEKKCCVGSCSNRALALTAQCYIHITGNVDQHLFLPCTAKFADNTQCRIPVFDISHELPLCREHGWKRDNYNRIAQEQRPKIKVIQKRTKSNGMCGRPPKRSKKKRKGSTSSLESIGSSSTTFISTPTRSTSITLAPPNQASNRIGAKIVFDGNSPAATIGGGYTIKLNETTQSATSQSSMLSGMSSLSPGIEMMNIMKTQHQHQQDLLTQDMLSICENSSVYASSEDTGVGGLSESELMVGTQDAEEIPLGDTRLLEEHDLTNVLNNLPVDAFNELFTVVRQDEREEVERALELADKQIKSLQQMTGNDTDFLRDLLDGSDQILDDTDICTEIVSAHSPDTSGIDTTTLFVDGGSNSTAGSCTGPTPTDIRGLVQT